MENFTQTNMLNLATLTLADGTTYGVAAADPGAASLVLQLRQAMQLRQDQQPDRLLLVHADGGPEGLPGGAVASTRTPPPAIPEAQVERIDCAARHLADGDIRAVQLMRVSQALVGPAREGGALLVHAALIERQGWGLLLAGPGGVGKSTASRRIPLPWRAICDDSTLVVPDEHGIYWAHPWPTWSDFMYGGEGGRWEVGDAVRLKAIFFMEQAREDRIERVGAGAAVCLLLESVGQAMQASMHRMGAIEKRAVHLQRFDHVTRLVKRLPAYRLSVSKTGAFWHSIAAVLDLEPQAERWPTA